MYLPNMWYGNIDIPYTVYMIGVIEILNQIFLGNRAIGGRDGSFTFELNILFFLTNPCTVIVESTIVTLF